MPYRRTPNSAPSIRRALIAARDQYVATTVASERAISAELFAKLDAAQPTNLLNRFLSAEAGVDAALAAQVGATRDLYACAETLRMYVSHFHRVLDMGIARGYFHAGARAWYGRDGGATSIPNLAELETLHEAAQRVISGEAARAAAETTGYKAMAQPSAAEVQQEFENFDNALKVSRKAQERTDLAREGVSNLLPEALALATDIYDTVEFFYRKDPDASSRRQKCARWGVVYVYGAGETPPVPEQADITDITTPGPGQVHFHYDAVNATTFDVLHKAPAAAAFVKVADHVEAKIYQASGLAVGAHEFQVLGRNAAGEGPLSAVAVVQVN